MKFFTVIAIFVLSFLSVIFLMMKMAGSGMPQNPLDLEKDKIEYVIKEGEQQIVKDEMVDLNDFADYFSFSDHQREEESE